MTQGRSNWVITGLVAAVAVLATLLGVRLFGGGPRSALAQAVSEGSAAYMVGIVGPRFETRMPLVLIDTKKQVILIYEYDQARRRFFLRVARSYVNDRELVEASFGEEGVWQGPTVNDVREILRRGLVPPAPEGGGRGF